MTDDKIISSSHGDVDYTNRTRELYDRIADWYVRSFWSDRTDDDWINVCLSKLQDRSLVADIGCGPGHYARHFLDRGHRVICVDISARMIEKVRLLVPGAIGLVADMRRLSIPDAYLDCVFCAYSLNHLRRDELAPTIHEFSRVLKAGGVIILLFKAGDREYLFSATGQPNTVGLMTLFSLNEVKDAFRDSRLSVSQDLRKNVSSPNEFQHQKVLLVGSKLPD